MRYHLMRIASVGAIDLVAIKVFVSELDLTRAVQTSLCAGRKRGVEAM
jgi:hypothetical protein